MINLLICDECQRQYKEDLDRNECFDLCDDCYRDLKHRTHLLNDPDFRMELTRQTVGYLNATQDFNNERSRELRLRGFFACVMPEISLHKADKIVRSIIRK